MRALFWKTCAMILVLCLCSMILSGAAASSGDARPEVVELCVLPLGDSLTQGVGSHGSYRQHLDRMLRDYFFNFSDSHGRRYHFSFVGSNERTCTPKKPNERFPTDPFVEKHEGHCGYNARSVHLALRAAIHEYRCVPHVTMLMAGHNDAFQVARACKLKELDETPSNRHVACVTGMMKEAFHEDLAAMVSLLLRSRRHAHVLIGVNPTTRFPVLDRIIRQVLRDVAAAHRPSDERLPTRVHLVNFSGWSSADTFDSTHPNMAGSQRMATAWFTTIKSIVELLEPVTAAVEKHDAVDDFASNYAHGPMQPLSHHTDTLQEGALHPAVPPVEVGGRSHLLIGAAAVCVFVFWLRNRRGSVAYRRIPFATV